MKSSVTCSLIADGCVIEGEVENCVLFRGVKVGKGTKVKNSILMQDTVIGKDCEISNIITDKNVNICDNRPSYKFSSIPDVYRKGSFGIIQLTYGRIRF